MPYVVSDITHQCIAEAISEHERLQVFVNSSWIPINLSVHGPDGLKLNAIDSTGAYL